jgi:hypothetical protein
MTPFPQPIGTCCSPEFQVWIDGRAVAVLPTPVDDGRQVASFATYHLDHAATVIVRCSQPVSDVSVHPLRTAPPVLVNGSTVEFALARGANLALKADGKWLYLLHVEMREPPTADVLRFASGAVYEVGEIELRSNQTLWIEPGALVKGTVRAVDVENTHIGGGGILDSEWGPITGWQRQVVIENGEGITVRDVTLIRPRSWMLVLGGCREVLVENLHEFGACVGSDGVDIVGCQDVTIRGGLFRNNDDCVVVKAFDHPRATRRSWAHNVSGIRVEGLILADDRAGNGLEIGHELRVDEVRDIQFRDIDILHVHGYGAPFSINAGDRATVRDVLFEDIRVEHHYDKLINMRVMRSRFNRDEQRGQIRNVVFRNIDVHISDSNPGYTTSVMGGYDAEHTVSGVRFESFRLDGKSVCSLDELDCFTKHAHDITFA